MVKKDKSKKKKGSSPEGGSSKIEDIDFEKTTLDVDLKKFEEQEQEKSVPKEPAGLDETVILRAPPPEEERAREASPEPPPEVPAEKKKPKPLKKEKPPTQPKKQKVLRETEETPSGFSLLYVGFSLVIFLILAAGFVEALRRGAVLRVPALVAMVFGLLFLAGILLKKIESKSGFLWLCVSWFGFVFYSGFYFSTSSIPYFLDYSLSYLLGPFLAILGGILALQVGRGRDVPVLLKGLGFLGWLLVLLALGFDLLHGQSFEGGLWGPEFLSNLPLFLRPGVLALSLAFPLLLLASLLSLWFSKGSPGRNTKGIALPLILLSLMGTLLGGKLLARQGVQVPLVGSLVGESFFGSTVLDPNRSSLRLYVTNGKPVPGQDHITHLELAASLSQPKGKSQTSSLMVRNMEGNAFASKEINDYLILRRGDFRLKGGKAKLDPGRLGKSREIALVLGMPSLLKTQVKTATASAIFRLARQLKGKDQLILYGAAGPQILNADNGSQWKNKVDKSLAVFEAKLNEAIPTAMKKLSQGKGIRQIILLTDVENLPALEQRKQWESQAKGTNVFFDSIALGAQDSGEAGLYRAVFPSALGLELMSAAAVALGDYRLEFPTLPPLPRIQVSRKPDGQISLQEGKVSFQISSKRPEDIVSLDYKIDNEKPVELDPKSLSQSIDLGRLKVKPGKHQIEIRLTTQAGDTVFESVEIQYATQKPLQFIKPLDKDSVTGVLNVMFSPGRVQGINTVSIDLYADGNKIGTSTAEPYLISLDTAPLTPGEHTLQGVQTYSNGQTQSSQIQIQVNPQITQIKISRPGSGEFLSNLAEIEAEVGGGLFQQVQKVDFYVDGEWIGEALQAPFRFLWSNSNYPAGNYYIQARALYDSQATHTDAVQVQLAQAEVSVQADPAQSPTGRLFPENVEILFDASVTMNEPLGSGIKLDLAKYALSELALALPKNVNLFTRVFGGKSDASQQNCSDSHLLKDPAQKLDRLEARGTSPLGYALKMMGKDLKKTKGSRVGLLITDGWDRCGEDPISVAQQLKKGSGRIRLHIIYFADISPTNESLLKRMAEVTGGRIYKVSRQEDLVDAIRDAIQVNFSLYDYKNTPVVEQALSNNPFYVRTGDYRLEVDTAPPIQKENIALSAGGVRKFTVIYEGDQYQLREE